ncbi:hypothetical protein EV356DRAFT_500446 [Viridothelium virens]|uniref:Dipeptidase n=1 Tax=Viridothelium virens TaxID=1048519 RepID=A0A6A6HBP9_VIRVR|nr:hypothetical protein EV356DRAFT_500446 [Viridothelium virens]
MDDSEITSQVSNILASTPLIDGHNDWPHLIRGFYDNSIAHRRFSADSSLVGHVDLARLREGRSGGVFISAYVDCPSPEDDFRDETHLETVRDTLQQIDLIHRLIDKYSDVLALALSSDDILEVFGKGKIACLIGIEGLHQIGNSASILRMYHRLGVRYATLTHNRNNLYADSSTSSRAVHGGLSEEGRLVVQEMNRIGMLIDLSHASDQAARDVLAESAAPVTFSHSSAFMICANARNVPDETLDMVKQNNGIVMVSFVPAMTSDDPARATVEKVVDHIAYIGSRIGFEHVGVGSDFDGMESSPCGLEDVSKFPNLVTAMIQRGIDKQRVEKVLGRNILRVLREVHNVARAKGGNFPALEDEVKQLWNNKVRNQVKMLYPDAT